MSGLCDGLSSDQSFKLSSCVIIGCLKLLRVVQFIEIKIMHNFIAEPYKVFHVFYDRLNLAQIVPILLLLLLIVGLICVVLLLMVVVVVGAIVVVGSICIMLLLLPFVVVGTIVMFRVQLLIGQAHFLGKRLYFPH